MKKLKVYREQLDLIADDIEDIGLDQTNEEKEYALDEIAQAIREAVDLIDDFV